MYRVDGFVALRCVFSAMADCISAKSHALNRAFAIKALNLYFSSFMKSFKQQVYNVFLSRPARNTCALHLQTRLNWTSIFLHSFLRGQLRKKNFLLLRSLMEVNNRVNVSNHYSKKHDARHSWPSAKLREHLDALLREPGGKPSASELYWSSQWKPKPRSFLLKSSNDDSAESNEVLLWQKRLDMCLVWNLNLVRASHLTSGLGKTNAFAMLMKVSVEQLRERSFPTKKGQVLYQEKSNFRGDWKLFNSIIVC